MKKLGKASILVLALSIFAMAETQAQNVTIEVRNCTDETWCVKADPIIPIPSGCSGSIDVCAGPTLLGANSTTTVTFDPNCSFLRAVQQTGGGSAAFTSYDPSGPYGDFCVCWDYSGTDPVVTIYEGDCNPPCPAPDCP